MVVSGYVNKSVGRETHLNLHSVAGTDVGETPACVLDDDVVRTALQKSLQGRQHRTVDDDLVW